MAGKQLGKLRQWATEAILTKDRTTVTDEFRELEHDIDLRREGIQRLTIASRDYHYSLVRKKESLAAGETEKLLPLDAQGITMIRHGEEFGDESAYGSSLVKFGRAQCKIATLQEAMGLTFYDTFIRALSRYEDEIVDYQTQRKKLESRRLSYDAALTKVEAIRKNKKAKEREVEECEDELSRAKMRYDEASEDVHARMYAIQENELEQLHDLGAFLDVELNFFAQALELLQDVKASWTDEEHISRPHRPRPTGPSHSFARNAEDVLRTPRGAGGDASESDEERGREDGTIRRKASRKGSSFSLPGRKLSSRHRADSTVTERGDDGERSGKEGDKDKKDKRRSLGWTMSWGKSGKGKDKLQDSDDEASDDDAKSHRSARSTRSNGAAVTKSPKIKSSAAPSLPRKTSGRMREGTLTAPASNSKRAVALYDYTGTAEDELSFSQGQELSVVNQLSDDWWLGSFGGRQGLFPVSYVRLLPAGSAPSPPVLPTRPPPSNNDNGSYNFPASPAQRVASESEDSDHPFGDHYLVGPRKPDSGFGYGYAGAPGNFDGNSILSGASAVSDAESGDDERPVLGRRSPSPDAWDREREREREEREREAKSGGGTPSSWRATPMMQGGGGSAGRPALPVRAMSMKKTPPPPPPPRRPSSTTTSLSSASASSVNVGGTPVMPPRPGASRGGSVSKGAGLGASVGRREVHESPFD